MAPSLQRKRLNDSFRSRLFPFRSRTSPSFLPLRNLPLKALTFASQLHDECAAGSSETCRKSFVAAALNEQVVYLYHGAQRAVVSFPSFHRLLFAVEIGRGSGRGCRDNYERNAAKSATPRPLRRFHRREDRSPPCFLTGGCVSPRHEVVCPRYDSFWN